MHALLAHAYHLAALPIHLAMLPIWRPLAACLVLAVAGRLMAGGRGAPLVAGVAVLAGWLVLAWPATWPLPPIARLGGLALIVLADAALRPRRRAWLTLPATAAIGAWWLRGAPLSVAGIAGCVPVFLGLAAALVLSRRLARADRGWAMVAASGALAASLTLAGASPHWSRAALVPAVAALGLLGLSGAMPVLAGMLVMLAGAALVASDRGRLAGVDVACLVPLLTLAVAPHLARRSGRPSPAVAGLLAALLGIAAAWAADKLLSAR